MRCESRPALRHPSDVFDFRPLIACILAIGGCSPAASGGSNNPSASSGPAVPRIDAFVPEASGVVLDVRSDSISLDGRTLARLPRRGRVILPLAEAVTEDGVDAVQIVADPLLTMASMFEVLDTLTAARVEMQLRVESLNGVGGVPLEHGSKHRRERYRQLGVHLHRASIAVHDGQKVEVLEAENLEALAAHARAANERAREQTLPSRVAISFDDDAPVESLARVIAAVRGSECRGAEPCQVAMISLLTDRNWGGWRSAAARSRPPLESPRDIPKPENGGMDEDVIQDVVRNHIEEIRYCYNQGLVVKDGLMGRVTVHFRIGPDGAVAAAIVGYSELGHERVENCIAKATKRWTFPAPTTGGSAVVTYPFVLIPGGAPE